ncbi:TIGR03826 family flagellar region protein [Salsuginibacillus kocurii]|uniref:TIGR03826 family flagellar region protein n=1 Tax=Salsuginibacillus kocurii TaxID=427078 RepID=UPI000366F9B1|nr:TIGR03826 family flagellar region protein [Salsuginibacillus kocurii]
MENVDNCPRCGRLFMKALRDICDHCKKELDQRFEKVYKYMRVRENRAATIEQVVEATEVPEDDISRFVKEGRLKPRQFPNLTYPCDACGTAIQEGRICESCREGINKDLKTLETEQNVKDRLTQEERAKYKTYQSLDLDGEKRK